MLGQGDRLAGYEVEAVIARGGMGVVYRAHQIGLGRSVALKVIAGDRAADPTFRARFVREARIAASLDHPNVIPVFAAGDDAGELFIAMRLVDAADLERLIDRSGPLEPGFACRLVAQAAAGLHAAHLAGLVHRDVKPANILLAGPAEDPHVYVSDFGVAKSAVPGAPLTDVSEWVGTPGYAAPEQVRGAEVDARADVYALGCVLHAALTRGPGARAGDGPPPAIAAIVDRASAADPSARFQSARELADALLAAAGGQAIDGVDATTRPRIVATLPAATRVVPPSPGRGERGPGRERRRFVGLGFAAGFLAIVGGVVAVALSRDTDPHGGRPAAKRPPARTAVAAGPAAASGSGDTVLCGASSCTQSGGTVLVPIEGGSCVRDGASGTWTRLDSGSPGPMLICLPGSDLPRPAVPVTVPSLVGGRLDHVETALDRLGIPYRTSGGLFGIILESSDWTVCATSPPAGGALAPAAEVTVFVEHGC
jgi:Protein kinase domain/PASTA domain